MCVYTYIYIYIEREREREMSISLSLSLIGTLIAIREPPLAIIKCNMI